jgi:hypothetical protein
MIKRLSLLILLMSSWLLTSLAFAGPGFRVMNVIGSASLIDDKNETKNISKGIFLPINAKIMVSQGSQLTLNADSGAVFHLSSGTALEIWREQLVLLSGTMWIQSTKEDKDYQIETMNSVVEFKKSEFVVSFDDIIKKSQIFVISGHASIANVFMREKKELLVSGEISFVQKDFQQGMPRRPALIGNESLATVFSKFKGIKPGDDNFENILADKENNLEHGKDIENFSDTAPSVPGQGRSVASVGESAEGKGIYFIPKNFSAPKRYYPVKKRTSGKVSGSRDIASVKLKTKSPMVTGTRPVRVFDLKLYKKQSQWSALLGEEKQVRALEKRAPANVESFVKPAAKPAANVNADETDFDALMKELKNVSADHNEVY